VRPMSMTFAFTIGAVLFAVTICCATKTGNERVGPPRVSVQDPLTGREMSELHHHGATSVQLTGSLLCSSPCDRRRAQALTRTNVDAAVISPTSLAVESDGRIHGSLVLHYSGSGDNEQYAPRSVIFRVPGCDDAEVLVAPQEFYGDMATWNLGDVQLKCQ
jgi:hypothetical protein